MNYRKIALLVVFFAFVLGGAAKSLMFRHIEAHEGLSNSQINCVFQDSRGFMWFGTSSGLNRYDGHNMVVYRTRLNDLHSLPDSYIHSICEDVKGDLWVRTSLGYSIYSPVSDNFDRDIRQRVFEFGLDTEPTLVYVDRNGDYWFYIAGRGCYWYSVAQKILYPFTHGEKTNQLPLGEVSHLTECRDGVVLVYESGLLACVNGDKRRIVWMNDYIASSTSGVSKYSAFVDKNENVWVYGAPGLRVYNKEQDKWIPSLAALAGMWGIDATDEMNDGIVGVGQDVHGVLWIATRHHGLLVADPQEQSFTWARADKTNERALLHNSLRSLYVAPDKSVIWLGTAKSGLAYYSESAFKFQTDVKVDVTAIAPDGKDAYWLGTSKHGILHYNPSTGGVVPLKTGEEWTNHEIFSMLAARDGSLWVGTNKGKLFRIKQGQTSTFMVVDADNRPADFAITSLIEDVRGNVWIATQGGGVQRIEPGTGKRLTYTKASHNLLSDKVNSLSLTSDKKILLGTPAGVVLLHPEDGQVTSYVGCRQGTTLFTSLYVNQVIEDSRGLWWIATRDGVNIYNPKTDQLDVIGAAEGFRNAVVCGLAPSGPQMVWASTAGGVTNIVVDKNETNTGYLYRIYNYTEEDGLQGYEFNQRSIWVKPDGQVAVGGIHGLNVFDPSAIVYNKKQPKVIFSSLNIFDNEVKVGEYVNGKQVMSKALANGGQIELDSRKHKAFTITFGSDDYAAPFRNSFKYHLEGLDEDWHECTPLKYGVTFTNLAPGKYVLAVKAANSDGYSSAETAQLTILVRGSFWTSGWAYLIYILVAVLIVAVWMFWWKRKLKNRYCSMLSVAAEGEQSVNMTGKDAEALPVMENADRNAAEHHMPVVQIVSAEKKLQLIVVDDNEEFLTYIKDCLNDFYQVVTVKSAEDAWVGILQLHPDAVLLSVTSDESDIYVLAARMQNDDRTSAIPTMMLTGRDMQFMPFEGVVDTVLPKPFTSAQLRQALQQMLTEKGVGEKRTPMTAVHDRVDEHDVFVAEAELLVTNATRYVEENLSRSDLSVEDMSRHMGMSRAHLYKRLMAACGKTPVEFIRLIRLKHAAELLKDPRFNVSEVAYQVGFNSPKYFSRYFADVYGLLPSAYQEKYRNKR